MSRREPILPHVTLSCALSSDVDFKDGMLFGDGQGLYLMEIVKPRWWDLPRWWVWHFQAKSRVNFIDGSRAYRARPIRSTRLPREGDSVF